MSFIEVLIALVILVTGILGAVAMQATAKKGSLDALQRSIASALTQDILERMRSNDVNELNNYANTY
jgi:type IV pilus assembly protein PilV